MFVFEPDSVYCVAMQEVFIYNTTEGVTDCTYITSLEESLESFDAQTSDAGSQQILPIIICGRCGGV